MRKKQECPKPPSWLTSFSDLMSLLLTFFILLYAMSTLEIPALEKFLSYFRKNPEVFPRRTSVIEQINHPKDYAQKIKRAISRVLPPWAYQIVVSEEYLKLRLFDRIFFKEGAKLTKKAKETLMALAPFLVSVQDRVSGIRVEGHVSFTYGGDKWFLSALRAGAVVRFLEDYGVDRRKLSAVAYGDTRPLYRWRQTVLEERNNRVEIIIYFVRQKEENNIKHGNTEGFPKDRPHLQG
ncbi:MAG: flagellar motor protein MotB [Aquificae bacterium]|nr:flagellar motor protein MotB [Aquificota bacterium]